jgi:hypothetical protein
VSNKEKWQQMQQGPKITLNKMREMARNLKGAKKEALRAGNKLNENEEQISQII